MTKLFGDWVLAAADDVEGEGEDEPGNVEGDGDDDPDDGGFNIHEPGNVKGEGDGVEGECDFKFHEPEAGEGDFHFHEPEAGRGDFDFHEPNDGEPDEEEVQVPPAPPLRGSEGELYVDLRAAVFVVGLLHVVSTLTEKMDSAMHNFAV